MKPKYKIAFVRYNIQSNIIWIKFNSTLRLVKLLSTANCKCYILFWNTSYVYTIYLFTCIVFNIAIFRYFQIHYWQNLMIFALPNKFTILCVFTFLIYWQLSNDKMKLFPFELVWFQSGLCKCLSINHFPTEMLLLHYSSISYISHKTVTFDTFVLVAYYNWQDI